MARFRLTVDVDIDMAATNLMAETVILENLDALREGRGDSDGLAATIEAAIKARGLSDGTLVLRASPETARFSWPAADHKFCMAQSDGDCDWPHCPQTRDGEPHKSGRSCPKIDRREKGES